jgi:hypothetical protein
MDGGFPAMRKLALVGLLLLVCGKAHSQAAPTFDVGFTAAECSGMPTTCQVTIATGTIPSAHIIVFAVTIYDCINDTDCSGGVTVTDDAGSVYLESPSSPVPGDSSSARHFYQRLFYTLSSGSGGGTHALATYASGGVENFIMMSGSVYSYSGTAGIDAHNFGNCEYLLDSCSQSFVTSASAMTHNTNELLVAGGGQWQGGTWTGGSDGASGTYTIREQNNWSAIADVTESSKAAYSATLNFGNTTQGAVIMLGFCTNCSAVATVRHHNSFY